MPAEQGKRTDKELVRSLDKLSVPKQRLSEFRKQVGFSTMDESKRHSVPISNEPDIPVVGRFKPRSAILQPKAPDNRALQDIL